MDMRKHLTDYEKKNNPILIKDIREIVGAEIKKKFDLLARKIDKNRKRIIELENNLDKLRRIWKC